MSNEKQGRTKGMSRRLIVLLATVAAVLAVPASSWAPPQGALVTVGTAATAIGTCNGGSIVTATFQSSGDDAGNVVFQVAALPDFTIMPLFSSDGYLTSSVSGFQWNDPLLAIKWPAVANPVSLSAKDRQAQGFAAFQSPF